MARCRTTERLLSPFLLRSQSCCGRKAASLRPECFFRIEMHNLRSRFASTKGSALLSPDRPRRHFSVSSVLLSSHSRPTSRPSLFFLIGALRPSQLEQQPERTTLSGKTTQEQQKQQRRPPPPSGSASPRGPSPSPSRLAPSPPPPLPLPSPFSSFRGRRTRSPRSSSCSSRPGAR